MKYKIETTVFNSGRTVYQPYVRRKFLWLIPFWQGLISDEQTWSYSQEFSSEREANNAIELHKKGNHTEKKVTEKFV